MVAKIVRRIAFVSALLMCATFAARAEASCCGGGATAAYYQPAAYTAYSPVAYQTYSSGWYPGYWLNRIRSRLWGSPSTYVAAYPTYAASYAPTYASAYRPAYSAGYATSYAMPAAPACTSCAMQTVGYAPAPCASGCSPCAAAAAPVATSVVQAVHQAPPPCASCAPGVAVQGTTVVVPGAPPAGAPPQQMMAPGQDAGQPRTFDPHSPAPSLDPGASVPEREQGTQRPPSNGTSQPMYPGPADESGETGADTATDDDAAYFQAPRLFDPNDRSASRHIAPVTTALYEKPAAPVAYRPVSVRSISRQQAELDAAGWVSSSR